MHGLLGLHPPNDRLSQVEVLSVAVPVAGRVDYLDRLAAVAEQGTVDAGTSDGAAAGAGAHAEPASAQLVGVDAEAKQ